MSGETKGCTKGRTKGRSAMRRGMEMRKRQQGMTLIGMVIVAMIAGIFVLAALRLVPVYLEYMKIDSALDAMKRDLDGSNPGPGQIRSSLQRRFDIDSVNNLKVSDIKIERTATGYKVQADYEGRTPFIANVYFVVDFDKSVEVVR
jgi:Tfp pilus assembly major pilin PilA